MMTMSGGLGAAQAMKLNASMNETRMKLRNLPASRVFIGESRVPSRKWNRQRMFQESSSSTATFMAWRLAQQRRLTRLVFSPSRPSVRAREGLFGGEWSRRAKLFVNPGLQRVQRAQALVQPRMIDQPDAHHGEKHRQRRAEQPHLRADLVRPFGRDFQNVKARALERDQQ